jgi:hypothetical protein
MLGALFDRLLGFVSGDSDAEADADEEGGFRPSRLDASVLSSHGARVAEPEETDDLEAEAEELERLRRRE